MTYDLRVEGKEERDHPHSDPMTSDEKIKASVYAEERKKKRAVDGKRTSVFLLREKMARTDSLFCEFHREKKGSIQKKKRSEPRPQKILERKKKRGKDRPLTCALNPALTGTGGEG